MNYDLEKMSKMVQKYLDKPRYTHTLGVMYTCAALAMAHSHDIQEAQAAGLLHDCAKSIPNKEKLKICKKNKISISEFEEHNPFLLHGKLGAFFAKTKYGIEEKSILSAITYHTTGKPDMNELEKIVYIADYIEPLRDKAQHLTQIRKLAFVDLDTCMYEILKDTLAYLEENPGDIDTMTKEAYAYYKTVYEYRQGKEENHESK